MTTTRLIHHGEPIEVQVLTVGQEVFWNGHRCRVSIVYTDGDVLLTEVGTGNQFMGFSGYCTTLAQAS